MPKYLVTASHTADGAAGLKKDGGKLESIDGPSRNEPWR